MRVRLRDDLTRYDARLTVGQEGVVLGACGMWSRANDRFTTVRFDCGAQLDVLRKGLETIDSEALRLARAARRLGPAALEPRGSISLHGYNRPGHGFIQGRCFGAQCAPWSQSCSALVDYISMLGERVLHAQATIAHFSDPALAEVVEYPTYAGRPTGEAKTYKRGERYSTNYLVSVDMFASIVARRIQKAEYEVKALQREIARQTARVQGWVAAA